MPVGISPLGRALSREPLKNREFKGPQSPSMGDQVHFQGNPVVFPWTAHTVSPEFHRSRREAFMAKLPAESAVIVLGGQEVLRNQDVTYPFRQTSDFYYLTGFEEPNGVAIITKNAQGEVRFTLGVPPKDWAQEVWHGRRLGTEGAKTVLKADNSFELTQLASVLPDVLRGSRQVALLKSETLQTVPESVDKAIGPWRGAMSLADWDAQNQDVLRNLHQVRRIKTPEEIELLQKASDLSAQAHTQVMKDFRGRSVNEGQIQAHLESLFRQGGGRHLGYGSIVAGGENGCILHYVQNNAPLNPKDNPLVLIDAAAEFGYQTADITRTWPLSGRFTREQRAVYEGVLTAQEAVIQSVRPGETLTTLHEIATKSLKDTVVRLGILPAPAEGDEARKTWDEQFRKLYMHGTSHLLGMDVHDVHGEKDFVAYKAMPLEPGMVLTVEPGLYISEAIGKELGIPKRWWGIGIRIEDNILVTEEGHRNLTRHVPKDPDAIQDTMGSPLFRWLMTHGFRRYIPYEI